MTCNIYRESCTYQSGTNVSGKEKGKLLDRQAFPHQHVLAMSVFSPFYNDKDGHYFFHPFNTNTAESVSSSVVQMSCSHKS